MKKILFILGFMAFGLASYANNGNHLPILSNQNSNIMTTKNVKTNFKNIVKATMSFIQINDDTWICCGSVQLSNGNILTNCVGAETREEGDNFILAWMTQFEQL